MGAEERLAEWEIELLTPVVEAGDLVRAEKGESIFQGRADAHGFVGQSGRTVRGLVADGFNVRVVEKAKPKLPTERGLYTTAENLASTAALLYLLDSEGWSVRFHSGDWERRTPEQMLAKARVESLVRLVREEAS